MTRPPTIRVRLGLWGRILPMAKRSTVLKVTGLRKSFGPVVIVDGFDLEVREGEAIALTGRNGAGKSTILRCLVGADTPDEGTVEVNGIRMSETNPDVRRNVATVIDDLDFFPDLSVVEHLDLLARAHGVPDPETAVDEVLHEVQLVPQSGQLPGTLSSGQRRRRPGGGVRCTDRHAERIEPPGDRPVGARRRVGRGRRHRVRGR